MPPSTDCSAGISCGGFRLPSDPRVPSIESRCVTDKAAVLRCVLRRYQAAAARKPFFLPGADAAGHPQRHTLQVYRRAPTFPAGRPASILFARARTLIPKIHRLSTEGSTTPRSLDRSWCLPQCRRPVSAAPKQVFRYASPPCLHSKAGTCPQLWITCALRGIACAQLVGEPVETKKVLPHISS